MIEYIAESLRRPSSPGAQDGDHLRKMPSNVAPNPSIALRDRTFRASVFMIDPGNTKDLERMARRRSFASMLIPVP